MPSPSHPRSIRGRARTAIALAAGAVVLACSGSDSASGPGAETPTNVVPTTGGTVATTDSAVKLVFPAGAVPSATTVTITPAADPTGSDRVVAGTVYELGPDGTQFDQPVRLELRFDAADVPATVPRSALRISHLENGAWVELTEGAGVDSARGIVRATIHHFSTYAITVAAGAGSCTTAAYALGTAASGAWQAGDCASDAGVPLDRYTFTAAQQANFRLTVGGAAGRTIRIRRGSATGPYVAGMADPAVASWSQPTFTQRYLLAPDTYVIEVGAPSATERSGYTLASTVDAGSIDCSLVTWWTPGITVNGTLADGDCQFQGAREDWMLALLPAGLRLRAELTTTGLRPVVAIKDDRAIAAPVMAREFSPVAGGPVRAEWTTTYAGSHEVIVTTYDLTDAGSYQLRLDAVDATNTCTVSPFTIGGGAQAAWDATDCWNATAGRFHDRYDAGTAAPRAFRTVISGPARKTIGVYVDTVMAGIGLRNDTTDLVTQWFLKPGAVELRPGRDSAGASYFLTSYASSNITGCVQVFAQQGATIPTQHIEATDCYYDVTSAYEDRILYYLTAGTTFTASMSADFANVLALRSIALDSIVARDIRTTPGTAQVTYVVPTTGYYMLIPTTYGFNVTGGTYTLSVP